MILLVRRAKGLVTAAVEHVRNALGEAIATRNSTPRIIQETLRQHQKRIEYFSTSRRTHLDNECSGIHYPLRSILETCGGLKGYHTSTRPLEPLSFRARACISDY
ncbi:hypothetical protein TNCV_3386251 [Trichonephila clavipes]|nr:hypothetical protein TNCV_3386251 [Trichonephila clavipes]